MQDVEGLQNAREGGPDEDSKNAESHPAEEKLNAWCLRHTCEMQADYETFHVPFNEYRELMLEAVKLAQELSKTIHTSHLA